MQKQRCYQCFRPNRLCYCRWLPRIENRTSILLLQHLGERKHPFNTARMVQQSLVNCECVYGTNHDLRQRRLPIRDGAALLFPNHEALPLSGSSGRLPSQLVVVDGTWHQAGTVVRDVPAIRALPRFSISTPAGGRYRIRREPTADSLSTVEAVVESLRILEPETPGVDTLLNVFLRMVEDQVRASRGRLPRSRRVRPAAVRHLPARLLGPAEGIVVAYGDVTSTTDSSRARLPVNWHAVRLGTGDRFARLLTEQWPASEAMQRHAGLTASDLTRGVPNSMFCDAWRAFLRRGDVLVVYHARTAQLLSNLGAVLPPSLSLKSICRTRRRDFRSLEELMLKLGISEPEKTVCRAAYRLEMAIALVHYLRGQVAI